MNPIKIGNKRELFWDDYLINTSLTGACRRQHSPRLEEVVMEFNMPWEGDGCDYFSVIFHEGVYRMYYLAWEMLDPEVTVHTDTVIKICCIESTDGIHWYRPQLTVRPFPGYETNNILLDENDDLFDNFHVFIDENPACPPQERFKATASGAKLRQRDSLWCWVSADGYHWKKSFPMTDKGRFDTQNVAFWSPEHSKYFCFIRDFHDIPEGDLNAGVRDIRVITSTDFRNWTDPVPVDFGGADDIPLYTSAVFRYPGAPEVLVGMPTRYVERLSWTPNFDQLTGAEARKKRCRVSPRYGLTVTDCVLMLSRDGFHWDRFDAQTWLQPGIERDHNWVYGDGYPAVGVIRTPSALPGAPEELSFFAGERHWSQNPAHLRRFTVRQDGLFSYRADYAPKTLVTKPLLYEGGQLHLNFATSARGYIYVTANCGKETIKSCELFGDTLDRTVPFDGDLRAFEGKEVTLEFVMSDADLYSMQFVK